MALQAVYSRRCYAVYSAFLLACPGGQMCKIYFFGGTYALQKNIFCTPCRLQLAKKTP